jgi:predicted nucleic acid-binding protein
MRVLFDTSVLIAGFVASHPQHHTALPWLQRAKAKEIAFTVAAYSIAECFAVLTRLPLSPRISPDIANYLVRENIKNIAKVVALSAEDYLIAIKRVTELGLTGGIVYDALIVRSAVKAKVDKILTFNTQDFLKLHPEDPAFILAP